MNPEQGQEKGEKIIKIIRLLRPDVAVLSFETYCAEESNVEATKTKLNEAAEGY